jgi:plasmid segregation protein ParM
VEIDTVAIRALLLNRAQATQPTRDARLADDVFSTRNMDNDHVLSPEYLAVACGAMTYMRVQTIDLLLVGLPVSTFALKKTALENRLTGMHDLGTGKKVSVRKVRVLAQPHGALK